LLQIEKIQAGQLTIFKKPVDIVELIKTSIDGNRSLALQKNTDFYLSSEQSCLLVNIDRSRIQQVIETLLINMAKAAVEKNTVAITITCSENYLLVDMRSHNLATDKPLDTDGEANNAYPVGFSELQFNLCKARLELHGGKLGFKNRSDRSNSIWFQLPLPIETNNAV
jgi:K+-sensing histidine kinase KdpD